MGDAFNLFSVYYSSKANTHRILEVFQVLVNEPIHTERFRNFVHAAVVGHQLSARGDVDPVHVGKLDGGRSRGEKHFLGLAFAGHVHDFAGGGAADDAVVD